MEKASLSEEREERATVMSPGRPKVDSHALGKESQCG